MTQLASIPPAWIAGAAGGLGGAALIVWFAWYRRQKRRWREEAQRLQQSENRWKSAVEGSSDGVWEWHPATDEVNYSTWGSRLLGFSGEELHNRAEEWRRRVHLDDSAAFRAGIQAHLEGITPTLSIQYRMQAKSGDWRWVLTRGRVIERDAQGKPTRAVGTHTDITAQKEAEAAVRRKDVFNDAIVNTVDALIVVLDPAGHIVRFNPAAERLSGWQFEEIKHKLFWDILVPEEQRAGVREVFARLTAGMFPSWYENDWISRDGSRRWIAWANSVIFDERGQIENVIGTGVDVTEQRKAAEALRVSEERWKFALEGAGDGVWDRNLVTEEVVRSKRWKEMLGYTADEIGNNSEEWESRLHPEDRDIALAPRDDRSDLIVREYRMRCKDGSWKWILARGMVTSRDASGRPLRMIGTNSDITERKAAEHAIRQLNADLENRVATRTTELAQRVAEVEKLNAEQQILVRQLATSQTATDQALARYQQANASLMIANQELESFSYSISHDLRAPLRNITGFLELLEKRASGALDPEAQRFVTVATAEAKRLSALIDDLLAFSRINQGELNLEVVSLETLVQEARDRLQSEIGTRIIKWDVSPLPPIRGDRALIGQVVDNLLGNAVKFTRQRSEAVIAVRTEGGPDTHGYQTFAVEDNGAGFNPKYTEKLFGVFQRLHNARDFEGTGIGLANVKRIVTRHGGRVWAEGKLDKGAVFHFTLLRSVSPP